MDIVQTTNVAKNTADSFREKLRSADGEARIAAAKELLRYVNGDLKDEKTRFIEAFLAALDGKTDSQVYQFINSVNIDEKKCGIFMIVCLAEHQAGGVIRYTNYLLKTLSMGNMDEETIKMACRALAYLIQTSKSYAPEQVDRSLEHCMEWLQETSRNEGRRLAAVHLSREIAIFTPTAFFLRANIFFEYIFNAFKDPVPNVRVAAIDALHAVLSITSQRESKQKKDWYRKCFDAVLAPDAKAKMMRDKTTKPDDVFHSMALITNELLRIADSTFEKVLLEASYSDKKKEEYNDPIDWIITARYPQTVECSTLRATIKERLSEVIHTAERIIGMDTTYISRAATVNRSVHLNQVLMQMLPRICAYSSCPASFHKLAMDTASHLLYKQSVAALAIGLMMMANPGLHRDRLAGHLGHVRDQLSTRKKQDENYFRFLFLIVDAYHEDVTTEIQALLPVLLKSPLSRGLTNVLKMIMMRIPKLRLNVQDGVMAAVYQNLTGAELPSKSEPVQRHIIPKINMATENPAEIERIVLSIDTLGEFYFSRGALQRIMQYVANYYLVVDQVPIRLAAVKCCCDMVAPFVEVFDVVTHDRRQTQLDVIHGVIKALVAVIVVDPSVDVRLKVVRTLREMSPKFLVHLAQPEMLEVVFMALHDERLEVQEACVSLLGRLSELNPALVFPRMRKMLLETLSQLTNSSQARLELHAAKLISLVAQQSPKFIRPYIGSLLTALIPKMRSEQKYADVTVQVLNAVSELAVIGGAELVRAIDPLFKKLTVMVTDSSSLQRREAALRSIGRICRSTAYVVDPYREYPTLLDDLLRLLKTVMSSSVRREAIKTLGILGAIDPYIHKVFTGSVQSAQVRSTAFSLPVPRNDSDPRQHVAQWFNYEKCTLEEYYPAITIAFLMQMIQDDAYSPSYREIAQALLTIFRSLGEANMHYIEQVVPQLLRACEVRSELKAFFLRQLSIFVAVIEDKALPYMKDIFVLIAKSWHESRELQITVIESLETMGSTLKLEFSSYISELIPYFLEVLQTDKTKDRQLTIKVMACLKPLANCLPPYLHLVVPPVLCIMDDPAIPVPCRCAALSTVLHFAVKMDMSSYAPRMLQSWHHSIHIVQMQDNLCKLLLEIVQQLPRHFKTFRRSVEIKIEEHRLKNNYVWFEKEYRKLMQKAQITAESYDPFAVNGTAPWKKEEPVTTTETNNSEVDQCDTFGHATKEMEVKKKNPNDVNSAKIGKQRVDAHGIIQKISVDAISSREEWAQWLMKTRTHFLKSSSSPSLKAASAISDVHQHLAKDLFHAAFMSVWTEMDHTQQDRLTKICLAALNSGQTDVIQTILNLAEFMAHSEKGPLPIGADKLGKCAEETRAYAKALRYKEIQILKRWETDKNNVLKVDDCQALITFANKLNVQEEAAGVVRYAERNNMNIPMQGRWYEKLNEWEKALESYEIEKKNSSGENDTTMHEMRCLEALGKWEKLNTKAANLKKVYDSINKPLDHKVAVIAARGAWAIGDWERVSEYVNCIGENTQDGVLLRAVIAVHNNEHEVAETLVDKVRDIYDTDLTAMASESYERAYGAMVFVQQMAEIEEAIEYKVRPERRPRIALLWSRRLQGIRQNVEQWQRLLMLRSLVLTPNEMHPLRVKFASLCRKQGKTNMSKTVMCDLMDMNEVRQSGLPYDKPQLVMAIAKQFWYDGKQRRAFDVLENLGRYIDRGTTPSRTAVAPSKYNNYAKYVHLTTPECRRICAKVFLKLGEWTESLCINEKTRLPADQIKEIQLQQPIVGRCRQMAGNGEFPAIETMISYYQQATAFDPSWHKAWHKLAFGYFRATEDAKAKHAMGKSHSHRPPPSLSDDSPPFGQLGDLEELSGTKNDRPEVTRYAVKSIESFGKVLKTAPGSNLQVTLRLLQMWFEYARDPEVYNALSEVVAELQMSTWLEVVPQLMARLDTSECRQVELVKKVLIDICKQEPQSLLYPLTVAARSEKVNRARNAREILNKISEFHGALVEEAFLVSSELVRCAILWHEQWYDALEEAGRLYYVFMNKPETDIAPMFETLTKLHARLHEHGATTLKEMSFNQTYSADLESAVMYSKQFLQSRNMKEMNQAWEAYCIVFKKLRDQMNNLTSLDLNYISPRLMRAKDMDIAIPGTYDPSSSETVRISYFYTRLQIITSKQRPRKMVIRGSNGLDYQFLLKGHEDPRQDERVMQLFGLVNTLLANNNETARRNLTIQRYSIVALSRESGLIGWMPNCDTLHALVKEYREKKAKISLSIEHKKLQSMTADTERMTLMQKLQLFEMALNETKGDDLRQILWLKSPSSEVWFDRRTNYTRSISCMSMVGYILGLGDRHPSNLMLDRLTGKIVHIDFGDCFEVAMQREKFPEKIPFRLTRMLINAMEITGIEGTFRLTCEGVLKVLRANRESLMAVLEAFVYDPVINWRLNEGNNRRGPDEKRDPSKLQLAEAPRDVSHNVISKITKKLTGFEFDSDVEVSISDQLDRLVAQATDHVNLCQCYIGWCPFW